VRLYVDGDMDSLETLTYWMHFCERFPENSFYGYSKSWAFFEQWHKDHNGAWPSNYQMNLSSGTKLERILSKDKFQAVVKRMLSLKNPKTGHRIARGYLPRSRWSRPSSRPRRFGKRARSSDPQRERLPRGRLIERTFWQRRRMPASAVISRPRVLFVCPGYLRRVSAQRQTRCGDPRFTDVAIVIGIH